MNGSFTNYLPKIGTGMQIERSMRLIEQGLSISQNRGKGTEAGEIRNWMLGEMNEWRNRRRDKSKRSHESNACVNTNGIKQGLQELDHGSLK